MVTLNTGTFTGDSRQTEEQGRISLKYFRHDGACLPFTVRNTQDKGNIIVAVRDIKPFETILVDTPAIIGPFDDSLPECPECYREVSVSGYKVRGESESGDWFVPLVML